MKEYLITRYKQLKSKEDFKKQPFDYDTGVLDGRILEVDRMISAFYPEVNLEEIEKTIKTVSFSEIEKEFKKDLEGE